MTIIMYATTWCVDCRMAKQVFSELNVKYNEINIEEDTEAAKKVEQINGGFRSVPTIVFSDGTKLVEPSRGELIQKLQTEISNS